MSDPKKPDLPDLPEKIDLNAEKKAEEAPVVRPLEDSGTRALSDALSSSFKIIRVLMIGLVVIFLGSGVFTVEPNEVAVVLRFGKPLGTGPDQVLQQGLHWSFPSPIDEIVKIKIGETSTIIATNSWYAITPEQEISGQLPYAMPSLRPGVDGYALTADGNIVHVKATAQYLINDPVAYEFNFLQTTNLLQNALNNAILYASAQFNADDVLYKNRLGHKEKLRSRFLQIIQNAKLGIEVQSLDVVTYPPIFVKEAFDAVTQTEQDVSKLRNEAEGAAAEMLRRAEGEAQAIINSGLTRSNRITSMVTADAKTFQDLLPHYEANPEFFRQRAIIERMGKILENSQDTWMLSSPGDGQTQELRLQLNREPTLTGRGEEETEEN